MSKVAFRLATAKDLDALVTLRARFLSEVYEAEASSPNLLIGIRRYFQAALRDGDFVAFVASIGQTVVATTGLVFHQHPPTPENISGREGYILNIYTHPKFRGRGIARVLLKKLLDHAREAGCPRVSLHALPKGKALYKDAGFIDAEGEMVLALDSEDK